MKIKIILFLVIIQFIFVFNTNRLKAIINNDIQDSTEKIRKAQTDTQKNELIPLNQFLFADNLRYTLDGSLPNLHTEIKPWQTGIFTAVLTGIFIVQHEMQQNTIWKKVGPFWVQEDGKWSAYLDKGGHFYGTYMPSYVFGEYLLYSGFSWDDATLIGGALGLAYNTYVEIFDGHSQGFGFSPTDWFADVFGASFYVAQHYIPILQNFTPKFMYVKPNWRGEINRSGAETFIDNYSSQTFYMGINVHNFLPEKIKNYWPSWLELSLGYAVYSLSVGSTSVNAPLISNDSHFGKVFGNQKFLVSLDYNLIKLLPDGPPFWNWLKQGLNFFKLPSPTIEFGKTTKFYLLYPFSINIGKTRI